MYCGRARRCMSCSGPSCVMDSPLSVMDSCYGLASRVMLMAPRCEIHPPFRCFAHAGRRLSPRPALTAMRGLERQLFGRSFERPTWHVRQTYTGLIGSLARSVRWLCWAGRPHASILLRGSGGRLTVTRSGGEHHRCCRPIVVHVCASPATIIAGDAHVFASPVYILVAVQRM